MIALDLQPNREWWPAHWVDDEVPEGFKTPDASLGKLNDGAHAFGDFKADFEELTGPERLIEGQLVAWLYRDYLGTVTLTLNTDGSHAYAPEPPAETTTLWHYDSEMLADSPAEMAEFMREFVREGDEGLDGTFEIQVAHWSGEITLRFTALDGPPRFVLVEDEPAEQVAA